MAERANIERGFWAHIRSNPEDDTPRLVYADWLEEHAGSWRDRKRDFADRAEFIRLQCALAQSQPWDHESTAQIRERADRLLFRHRVDWFAPLTVLGSRRIRFHRGLPSHVCLSADDFLNCAEDLFLLAPIFSLKVDMLAGREEKFFVHTALGGLTRLDLSSNSINDTCTQLLAASPNFTRLSHLNLRDNQIGDVGAHSLAESPHLSHLIALDLSANNIGRDGLHALASSPHFSPDMTIKLDEYYGPFGEFQRWERKQRRINTDERGGKTR